MQSPAAAVEETPSRAPGGQAIHSRRSRYALVAWSLSALSLALLIGAIILIRLSAIALAAGGSFWPAYTYVTNGSGLLLLDSVGYALKLAGMFAFGTFGALVVARSPAHSIGWIMCALSLFGIGEEFATYYAIYGLIARPGALPFPLAAAWVTEWTWAVFFGLLNVFLPLLFPTGSLLSPRWQPASWFAGAACGLLTLAFMLKPGPLGNRARLAGIASPITLFAPGDPIELLAPIGFVCVLACMLVAAVALVVRLRRARGDERQQLKWFCYPVSLLVGSFVFQGAARYGLGLWSEALETSLKLAWAVAFTGLPIALGIAILKYRLYDIDLVINRTLVYGALATMISGIYVLSVGALGALFQARGNLLVSLLGAGLVAVLFGPLRDRLTRGVNRLLYGERDEPYAVLARLGRRLETAFAPNEVLPAIVATVRDALKLPYVAIALRQDGQMTVVAEVGNGRWEAGGGAATSSQHPTPISQLPLVYQNEQVGQLILAPRSGEDSFGAADRRLLDDLARQAGLAAHAVQLTADLQRSRERLVTAREEERRRLRRDLHDGLGPALATQVLKLEAARDLLHADPTRAEALLTDLVAESQAAIADIRRLVYALRPPALDELGLVGAIREQAAQYQLAGPLRIVVDAPERLPVLPAATEVAGYRITLEALNNVVNHAGARTCEISLGLGNGLHIDIRDDGRGIPEARRSGVGLASMRERAAELGGSCEIAPAPGGGTCVTVWLPIAL